MIMSGPDNPVRFVEAFVGKLGLRAARFVRVTAKETGVREPLRPKLLWQSAESNFGK